METKPGNLRPRQLVRPAGITMPAPVYAGSYPGGYFIGGAAGGGESASPGPEERSPLFSLARAKSPRPLASRFRSAASAWPATCHAHPDLGFPAASSCCSSKPSFLSSDCAGPAKSCSWTPSAAHACATCASITTLRRRDLVISERWLWASEALTCRELELWAIIMAFVALAVRKTALDRATSWAADPAP